jgi:tetratricopeptide (TPR) repeat protein
MRLYLAWIHLFAFDFKGTQAICETTFDMNDGASSPGSNSSLLVPLPAELRIALVLMGSAQVGLRNFEPAREYLSRAHDDLERRQVILGWYWRMPLEFARAELAIAEEDWQEARASAERFHAAAQRTAERTWQALAWRTKAQVALRDGHVARARACVDEALELVQTHPLPLAGWRVFEIAAAVSNAQGDEPASHRYHNMSRQLARNLAHSLAQSEPLREIFLSAPPVSAVLLTRDDNELLNPAPSI